MALVKATERVDEFIEYINNKGILVLIERLDFRTLINLLNICDNKTKERIFNSIPEYASEEIILNLDRLYNRISLDDSITSINIITDIITNDPTFYKLKPKEDYNFKYNINEFKGYEKYETIPKTIFNRDNFIGLYYDILWFLYILQDCSQKRGLSEIEKYLSFLKEDDFTYLGLNLVAIGYNKEDISPILDNYIRREKDFYRMLLKNIIADGINQFQYGKYDGNNLMVYLIKKYSIGEDYLQWACENFENGELNAFINLFKKDTSFWIEMNEMIRKTELKEGISLIGKALNYADIAHKEGLLSLREKLKYPVSSDNVLDYGLYYAINAMEKDDEEIRLSLLNEKEFGAVIYSDYHRASVDAVIGIRGGNSLLIIFELLLSYFDEDIAKEARILYKDYFPNINSKR
jgi:flagellar motor component MotA